MVDIIGRAKVIAETVIDEQQAKKAGKKAGDAAADGVAKGGDTGGKSFSGNFESIIGKSLPLAAVGVGAAVGTALGVAIGKSLEREASAATFAASLGEDAQGAAELNESAAKIYREAWGESFEAVQRGVAATKSSFRDLSGEELTEAARSAQIFADIFGVDVVEAAGVASVAVKQGLAKDAVEAFDLMTAAAQQVPMQFRSELLEAVTEYSSFFQSLGIEGPEAFALLAEGAALGQYGIDKVGDSIKEFQIRSIDASATTADAFKLLNLDITEMQTALAEGGPAAEDAFRTILYAIESIEDPVKQSQAALALFGTPLEDLSQDELPAFITALADGTLGLTDFEGATETAGDTAGGTFTSQLKTAGRGLDVFLGEALDGAIDKLSDFNEWIKDVQGGLDKLENAPTVDLGDKISFGDSDFINQITGGSAVGGPVPAGLRLVGEHGPELVEIGSSGGYVHNAPATEEILNEIRSTSGGGNTQNYYITGPVSLAELRQRAAWYDTYGTRFG